MGGVGEREKERVSMKYVTINPYVALLSPKGARLPPLHALGHGFEINGPAPLRVAALSPLFLVLLVRGGRTPLFGICGKCREKHPSITQHRQWGSVAKKKIWWALKIVKGSVPQGGAHEKFSRTTSPPHHPPYLPPEEEEEEEESDFAPLWRFKSHAKASRAEGTPLVPAGSFYTHSLTCLGSLMMSEM